MCFVLFFFAFLLSLPFPICAATEFPSQGAICHSLFYKTLTLYGRATIDESRRRQWILAQPKQFRPFAELLSSQIEIVSREQFFEGFDKSVNDFRKTIKPKDEIIFVFHDGLDDFSSGNWLIGRLLDKNPDLKKYQINRTGNLKQAQITTPSTRLVYVDDGFFGGSNFIGFVTFIRANSISHKSIEAVVPFTSTRAKKAIEAIGNITTYWQRILKNPAEKQDFSGVNIPPIMKPEWVLDFPCEFLDHKVPDLYSFLSYLSLGEVLNDSGTGFTKAREPFIHMPIPVYKQVNRLEMDPERKTILDR